MQRSGTIHPERDVLVPLEFLPRDFQGDPRWVLAQRVVGGSHFARSPLLSKFLLFVVAEAIRGRDSEITEHQIGVQVFDRPPGYRTIEDNIVRNYARQLRKRLAEHFADEGSEEPIRIDVPVGGYVPVFIGSQIGILLWICRDSRPLLLLKRNRRLRGLRSLKRSLVVGNGDAG